MKYRVAYFEAGEFLCPCCGVGRVARALVLWLDQLRKAWGGPVAVNSGCRCVPHNAEVGGSRQSRHLIGCAADVRPNDGRCGDFADFMALARRLGDLPDWEIRVYNAFVHAACPRDEAKRLWDGGEFEL